MSEPYNSGATSTPKRPWNTLETSIPQLSLQTSHLHRADFRLPSSALYLRDVLTRFADRRINRIDELLPWKWNDA